MALIKKFSQVIQEVRRADAKAQLREGDKARGREHLRWGISCPH